jgi:hypothetical protein
MNAHGWKTAMLGVALILAGQFPQALSAQADTSGWLEGMVTLGQKGGAADWWRVTVIDPNGDGVYVEPNAAMNNLYVLRHLKPGTYEVTVTCTSDAPHCGGAYRPQRIFGVAVKPEVRTTLNLVLEPGTNLQEVGHPVVGTEPALVLSQELARLQRQVASLEPAVDSLRRRPH